MGRPGVAGGFPSIASYDPWASVAPEGSEAAVEVDWGRVLVGQLEFYPVPAGPSAAHDRRRWRRADRRRRVKLVAS